MADVATRDDVARASALFTRGAMDAPDLRGDSMVTKHLEKIQQEKEKRAFAKMQFLHPSIGPTVCAIALEETAWEADAAHELVLRFEAEYQERIAALLKVWAAAALVHIVILYLTQFVSIMNRNEQHGMHSIFMTAAQCAAKADIVSQSVFLPDHT